MLPVSASAEGEGITNILLLGVDELIADTKDRGRTDTMILCSLNKKTGEINLAGFERAIEVVIPGHGQELLGYAYSVGGPELTAQLISEYFDVQIDGYVEMRYDGFIKAVDELGGIDVDLTIDEVYTLNGWNNPGWLTENSALTWTEVKVGMNHLDGYDTLMYCRLRAVDSDWRRMERQRRTLQILMDKTRDADLSTVNAVINAILPYVSTDLSRAEVAGLVLIAPRFAGCTFGQITIPVEGHKVTCNFDTEKIRLHDFLYGISEAETAPE